MKYKLDDLNLDEISTAVIYRPTMDDFVPSIIGCFIIGDDWDKQALLALKDKAGASALVGLQIDNTESPHLDSIKSIIKCQPNEVQNVIELLNVKSASSLIAIDVVDIENLFEGSQLFHFVQTSTTNNESAADSITTTTHNFVNRLSMVNDIKALLIGIESIEVLSLETLNYITEAVETALSDDISIYYSLWINPDFDSFKLKAIYAESFDCKGLHKTNRSTDSNNIQEYLRKQRAGNIANVGGDYDKKLPTNLSEKHRDKRVWTEDLPLTSLYSLTTSEYGLSKCGFFNIEEGWDRESLVELKDKIGATCLLGLQTTDKTIENFDVIDGVVICQPDEIDKVVALYDAILASEMTHPYNINDLKIPSWHIQPARFIEVKAIGMPDSEALKALAYQLIQQIPTGCIIDNILFFCEGHRFLSLIELNELTLIIESMCTDNTEAFYEMKTVDETDDFWMGMVYVAS